MDIKIAHCADVHIGVQTKKFSKFHDERRAEIKNTFFNMLKIVEKNNADLLLIAGDLFDSLNINDIEINEVKKALGKLQKIRVVISPGNHDPYIPGALYDSSWPENVFIFKENNINFFEIPEIKTRIWGSAFTPSNSSGAKVNLKNACKDKSDDFINILLTHGTYPSVSSCDYNPISIKDIRESNMDYIALGHIHKRTPILQEGKTFYAYSGCLEGTSFKDVGYKGFYLGTLSSSHCDLNFINVAKRAYLEVETDISGAEDYLEICDIITKKIKNTKNEGQKSNYKDNIYKVTLSGEIKENFYNTNYISDVKKRLEDNGPFLVEIKDETKLVHKSSGNTLKDIFIKNMENYIKNCEDEEEIKKAEKALKFGVMSFYREVILDEN